jgi:hypothetical protein
MPKGVYPRKKKRGRKKRIVVARADLTEARDFIDEDLEREILWVMKHYGSDAAEKANPGSKLRSQARRIAQFVMQREQASMLLASHKFDLVRVRRFYG